MKKYFFILAFILFFNFSKAQTLYFPPLSSLAKWDTVSPSSLGWCTDKIDSLYNFLQNENTKGFIVLKDGKIVLEKYFGTFTKDSTWYWASAGKTITSFLIGKAQEEGYLSINDSSSKYLGKGWTVCTPAQEGKIKIWNQITMTSGLDDGVPDNHCILDTCLIYKADAGTRWAYHNAPYTLLEKVIENATGQTKNIYTQQKLKNLTGMTGTWLTVNYDNVFYSKVRSMARFGLLIQNKCIWNKDTLIHDTAYIHQMTNTSQNYNYSYGYLWWLNGKQSYMMPGFQIVVPGPYSTNAPADMFAGLGKNGQIVSVCRSKGLVVVRMGQDPQSSAEVSTVLCDHIWQKLNEVMCNPISITEANNQQNKISVFPNPANSEINILIPANNKFQIEIINPLGKTVIKSQSQHKIDVSLLQSGIYFIKARSGNNLIVTKFLKL